MYMYDYVHASWNCTVPSPDHSFLLDSFSFFARGVMTTPFQYSNPVRAKGCAPASTLVGEAETGDCAANHTAGLHFVWLAPEDNMELSVRLGRRPLCPADGRHPFPNQFVFGGGIGCCAQKSASLAYARCDASQRTLRKLNGSHVLALAAATALRHRRVVVVGDSIHQQLADAFLLDLHGRQLLVGEQALTWDRMVRLVPKSAVACTDSPRLQFDARTIDRSAPIVSFIPFYKDQNRHPEYKHCLNQSRALRLIGDPPPFDYLARMLTKLRPHVVVAGLGIHWPGTQSGSKGTYARDVAGLVSTLTSYARKLAADRNWDSSPPLLMVMATPPQHFPTAAGDGAFDEACHGEHPPVSSSAAHHPRCVRIDWRNLEVLNASISAALIL